MKWLTQSIQKWHNPQPKGIVLEDYKSLSNHDGQIKSMPLYNDYYISLLQRDGEQSVPVVAIGEQVKKGDIIAQPLSNLALYKHAPTSGTVAGIVDITESHESAMTVKAIHIQADGHDTATQAFPPIPQSQWQDRTQLLQRILQSGIAGMGGAGFPTEKKINLSQTTETLIINGAECEPYITCDDLLMRHEADKVLLGAQLFANILSATSILVGIEDNKPEAIAAMQTAADELADPRITIHVLPTQYPMGSRHQLAHALLGQRFDVSKRAHQSGFICHNVATAKAAYDAIALGIPLTERLVTFSGDGIAHSGVYRTKVGTAINDLSAHIKLQTDCESVIFGGTMMGFNAVLNNPLPQVIKRETTSVLAFAKAQKKESSLAQPCIRCSYCENVCPMDLLPQQLQFYGNSDEHEKAESNRLFDCIECGLCTYVCPSDIPLVQVFQHSKGEILAERKKKADAEHAKIRFESRNQRKADNEALRAQKAKERRERLKQQTAETQKQAEQAATKPSANSHQDRIAAALARTQAKKAEREAQANNQSDKQTIAEKPTPKPNGQDLIAAALARTQAKKAEREAQANNQSDEDTTAEKPTPKASGQDLIAAALARTQAKKAEREAQASNPSDEGTIAEKPTTKNSL